MIISRNSPALIILDRISCWMLPKVALESLIFFPSCVTMETLRPILFVRTGACSNHKFATMPAGDRSASAKPQAPWSPD